jgi:hypothetical protein
MTSKRRRLERDRQQDRHFAPLKRTAARRKAIKTAQIAKIRDEGDARNAARKMGLPVTPRQRQSEPIARKPEAKAKATIFPRLPAIPSSELVRRRGPMSKWLTLAREQSSHHQGNLYSVMVEVRLPPQHDLAAKKQNKIKDMSAQLPALINQTFTAIERQLKKTAALRR